MYKFLMQMELFRRFKQCHPLVRVQLRKFESLKPYFIKRLKDRFTCCCIYHVQMSYLKDAVNYIRHKSSLHNNLCDCVCSICQADTLLKCNAAAMTFQSISSIIETILCPRQQDAIFHPYQCVMGKCTNCGTRLLQWCPKEVGSEDSIIPVKMFEDVESLYEGQLRKRKELVRKQFSPRSLIELFETTLNKFIKHNFTYLWQASQFKLCVSQFPSDVVVSVVDFAENYTFREQNEIQSMHWWSVQVTIFVHITYFRVGEHVKKVIHFFISDDKKHDTLFVQHCFKLHWGWLQNLKLDLRQHWVWSDGAASQFKAKRPFYFVGRYPGLTGMNMIWNFFESGHGKGEHDGAGAVVKRALTHEQLKPDGAELKCAKDVVKFLCEALSTNKGGEVSRVFWEVPLHEVNREQLWDCKGISQTRACHSIRGFMPADGRCIGVRALTCYCFNCMQGQWAKCSNRGYVQNWQYHTIEPTTDEDSIIDNAIETFTWQGDGDYLSDALLVDDNFAVNAEKDNAEGVDFYLLKCIRGKELARKTHMDGWQNMIASGTYYVEGLYYEKLEDNVYKLLENEPPGYIYSHLVRCIKVPMISVNTTQTLFTLDSDVYDGIYNSMPWELE